MNILKEIINYKKKKIIFEKKCNFTHPQASIKDVQATGEVLQNMK